MKIEFRVWNKTQKSYIDNYGDLFLDLYSGNVLGGDLHRDEDTVCVTDNVILEQYTNFDDKNGKKIFTGDRCWNDYEEEYGRVVFNEGKFRFEFDNVVMDLFEVAEDLEVIGNIHDAEVQDED